MQSGVNDVDDYVNMIKSVSTFGVERMELSKDSPSARLIEQGVKGEYSYAKLGLVIGFTTIICGTILGLRGIVGATSWTAKVIGFESNISDAPPGVVLFIVGLFMIYVTKPRVKLKDLKDK